MLFLLKVEDYEFRLGMLEAIVRASSEDQARQIVYELAKPGLSCKDWLDPQKSTCEALSLEGKPGVIMTYTDIA